VPASAALAAQTEMPNRASFLELHAAYLARFGDSGMIEATRLANTGSMAINGQNSKGDARCALSGRRSLPKRSSQAPMAASRTSMHGSSDPFDGSPALSDAFVYRAATSGSCRIHRAENGRMSNELLTCPSVAAVKEAEEPNRNGIMGCA
jgi:hypothetical protein